MTFAWIFYLRFHFSVFISTVKKALFVRDPDVEPITTLVYFAPSGMIFIRSYPPIHSLSTCSYTLYNKDHEFYRVKNGDKKYEIAHLHLLQAFD